MTTAHRSVTVTGTATNIFPATGGRGQDVTIQNNGSNEALLGGKDLTLQSYGFKLAAGAAISFELDGQDSIHAISENGTDLNILAVNLEKVKFSG